jgi:predicted DCC family thiol-disulfide oxidoreductase YuxK
MTDFDIEVFHDGDLGYRWFAKNRLRLTGRCADGACELHPRSTRS